MSLTPSYVFQGHGNWSLDATSGAATGGGTIQADIPAGSTVEKAFLYNTTYGGSAGSVTLSLGSQSDTVSNFTSLGADVTDPTLVAYRSDVTNFVSQAVGSGSSTEFDFTVGDIVNSPDSDGYALAIVYANPSEQNRTIAFLDGATNSAGDNFTVDFPQPVDTTVPGFQALLSLGIGFSFQPSSQYSIITVNGRQLSTSAGGQDDGVGQNGGLITIGGIGDSTDNPDPNVLPTTTDPDDELYDLAKGNDVNSTPFLKNGDQSLLIKTQNPSGDDNIFFAGINVTASASVTSRTIVGPGETLTVSAGETLSNILVESGGTLDVASGGIVVGVVVDGGGVENVFSGGTDSGTMILSGGFEDVFGSAISTTIANGGSQTVESGGSATSAVLDGAGLQKVSGFAGGTVVSSGDEQLIESGGVASGTVISSGGSEVVLSGGTASGTSVLSGGFEDVLGSAISTTISNGGSQTVEAGGSATSALLDGVGLQKVFGLAGGTVVSSSDEQLVESGGVASGTKISSGGDEVVLSGGVTSNTVINGGGRLEVESGGTASGLVTFSGSAGTLRLDSPATPAAIIGGLVIGDMIDEPAIAFAASDTATLDANNVLTVSGGGQSVTLKFDSSVAGKGFSLSEDSSGGLLLTLTSATAASTRLYGFVYHYLDGAAYTGTVADNSAAGLPTSKTVDNAQGNVVGVYSIFSEGSTTETAGTVVVDRFLANGVTLPVSHSSSSVDGTKGLGSEVGSVTVGEMSHSFSPTIEPAVSGNPETAPVTSAPASSDVVTTEVDQIFSDVLGRFPTASELDTYSGEINNGTTIAAVRTTLADGTEAQGDIKQLYQQIFAHAPTTTELSDATSDLAGGMSLAALQQDLADSGEAAGDINQIYLDVLGQKADPSGLAGFAAMIANETANNLADPGGLSGLAGVRDILAHSGVAKTSLTTLFQGVIGRGPSTAELVGMEDQVAVAGNTQTTLKSALSSTGSAGGYTTITAAGGTATLAAATGPSLFQFSDIAFNDTITGFDVTKDSIKLPKAIVGDFTTLQNDTASSGGGSLITLSTTQSIFITGVAPSKLVAGNFAFV